MGHMNGMGGMVVLVMVVMVDMAIMMETKWVWVHKAAHQMGIPSTKTTSSAN
jgi:hypothetical protein